MMLVGLCGRKRSGKDTAADLLVHELGFVRVALADALRDLVAESFGIPRDFMIGIDRERELGQLTIPKWESTSEGAHLSLSVRALLQRCGEGARRAFGRDFWLRHLEAALDDLAPGARVVVTDVRYPNEVAWLRRYGPISVGRRLVVRLNRSDEVDLHDFEPGPGPGRVSCGYVHVGTPDGLACGLARESHPTTWTADRHSSETDLPVAGSCYDAVVSAASAGDGAARVLELVRARL